MKHEINTNAMSRDAELLTEYAKDLQRAAEEMAESMEMLNQTWSGQAKTAYMSQYRTDHENLLGLCSSLNNFAEKLECYTKWYLEGRQKVGIAISQLQD